VRHFSGIRFPKSANIFFLQDFPRSRHAFYKSAQLFKNQPELSKMRKSSRIALFSKKPRGFFKKRNNFRGLKKAHQFGGMHSVNM
jgi:hypothetical protein